MSLEFSAVINQGRRERQPAQSCFQELGAVSKSWDFILVRKTNSRVLAGHVS